MMQVQVGGMMWQDDVQQLILPQQLQRLLGCAVRHQFLQLQGCPGLETHHTPVSLIAAHDGQPKNAHELSR